jgi:hypothetical protein
MAELCETVNAPLVDAANTALKVAGTADHRLGGLATTAIVDGLMHRGVTMGVDFSPVADGPDVTICPKDVIERPPVTGVSKERIARGLAGMAADDVTAAGYLVRHKVQSAKRRRT